MLWEFEEEKGEGTKTGHVREREIGGVKDEK